MTSRGFVRSILVASVVGLLIGLEFSPSAGLVIGAALAVCAISILPRPETAYDSPTERRETVRPRGNEQPVQWIAVDDQAPLVPFHVGRPSGISETHQSATGRRRASTARFQVTRRARRRRVVRPRGAQSPTRRR